MCGSMTLSFVSSKHVKAGTEPGACNISAEEAEAGGSLAFLDQ